MKFLTEAETFFGATAYRNKLITKDQLIEGVKAVSENPDLRLGEVFVQRGWMTQEQVEAVLSIQKHQRDLLSEGIPPAPPKAPSVEVQPSGSLQTPQKLEHLKDYLSYARTSGASDLHLSAGSPPFLRLNGRVEKLATPVLRDADTERLLFEVLSNDQKRVLLQKRGLEFCLQVDGTGLFRATAFKQRLGWDSTFRVIRPTIPSFEDLGLPDSLNRMISYNQGLVLVTGPSNSGKTTTLAALIDRINESRSDHIITIEQPIEYLHVSKRCQVNQRAVGEHTNSYAAALRAALREDPDVIMVGELRDLETLSMAISASETGHLVLGTLHTTSAARTISRIVDAFPVGQQSQVRMMLSESLRGILSQQLIPRKDGQGVVLALEVLFVTPAVSALLRDNKPFQIPSIIQTSRRMGMCRMDDSLLELLQSGTIDMKDALRRAENKQLISQAGQGAGHGAN